MLAPTHVILEVFLLLLLLLSASHRGTFSHNSLPYLFVVFSSTQYIFFLFFPPTKVPRFLYYNRQTESCMSIYLCIYLYTCLHIYIYISLCICFLLLLFIYYIDIYTF
ncbi:hypothetical protein, unlikely [Trypanosoma brucei brucei TREU927]|uniref:T. brucei spp.-specific protein n=1 Tax=Trypanosoma brucei brucei (strain 927/4 GUTat10.1) TaxID=185431 RepID=Q4GYZ1_TRYB2|nr:hypothetical protein, unlikely [Trypanosoma brucei brucei TREU927]CAJ16346.1 hypothetical protein, unlikely [Trypanosoma brucei brucei TREU927]